MFTEQKKLDLLLNHMDAKIIGYTPGDGDVTDEERARAIRKSLIAMRRNEPGVFRDIDLSF